jgi:hypothetical protein
MAGTAAGGFPSSFPRFLKVERVALSWGYEARPTDGR